MVFAVVKRIGGDSQNKGQRLLCKMSGKVYLEVGDMVLFCDSKKRYLVGQVCCPDFDADIAAVLDAWDLKVEDLRTIKAVLHRVDIAGDDDADGNDDGETDIHGEVPQIEV